MLKPYLKLLVLGAAAVLLTGQERFDYLAKRAYDNATEYSRGGQSKAAVKEYKEIIKKYPYSVWSEHAKMKIAEYYMSQRDYRNAKKELKTIKKSNSSGSLTRRRDIYERKVTQYYESSLAESKQASAKSAAAPFAVHLLRPGMTREEVRNVAGPPENTYQYSDEKLAAEIWYYGEWQVVFGREKYVSHINRKDDRKGAHFGSN